MKGKLLESIQANLRSISPGDPMVVLYDYLEDKIADVYAFYEQARFVQEYLLAHDLGLSAILSQTIAVDRGKLDDSQMAILERYYLKDTPDGKTEVYEKDVSKQISVKLTPFEKVLISDGPISLCGPVSLTYGDGKSTTLVEGRDYLVFAEDALIILLDATKYRQDYLGGFILTMDYALRPVRQLPGIQHITQDYVEGESIQDFLARVRNFILLLRKADKQACMDLRSVCQYAGARNLRQSFLETLFEKRVSLDEGKGCWSVAPELFRPVVIAKNRNCTKGVVCNSETSELQHFDSLSNSLRVVLLPNDMSSEQLLKDECYDQNQ